MIERPIIFSAPMVCAILDGAKTQTRRIIKKQPVGKEIIVRENKGFVVDRLRDSESAWRQIRPPADIGDILWVRETYAQGGYGPVFKASYAFPNMIGKWTPAIHMPRTVCRIFLEVIDVRAERLTDLGDSDCYAEGIPHDCDAEPRDVFQYLWESIYGADSWKSNPWVWVISFKVRK